MKKQLLISAIILYSTVSHATVDFANGLPTHIDIVPIISTIVALVCFKFAYQLCNKQNDANNSLVKASASLPKKTFSVYFKNLAPGLFFLICGLVIVICTLIYSYV